MRRKLVVHEADEGGFWAEVLGQALSAGEARRGRGDAR